MDTNYCTNIAILIDLDGFIDIEVGENSDVSVVVRGIKNATLKTMVLRSKYLLCPTQFRWSYSIFSAKGYVNSNSCGSKRHKFKEFSLDNFKEFEQSLDAYVQEALVTKARQEHAGRRDATEIRRSIQKAVADLQWTSPTIMSPIKRFRNKKHERTLEPVDSEDNRLLLFSVCPSSVMDLKLYYPESEIKVKAESMHKDFLADILPANLQRTLSKDCHIKFLYVDISPLLSLEQVSVNSVVSFCVL